GSVGLRKSIGIGIRIGMGIINVIFHNGKIHITPYLHLFSINTYTSGRDLSPMTQLAFNQTRVLV
ncbi:MAG: hypothetical protein ACI9C4_001581, partial [Paraglaciecola sp.]